MKEEKFNEKGVGDRFVFRRPKGDERSTSRSQVRKLGV